MKKYLKELLFLTVVLTVIVLEILSQFVLIPSVAFQVIESFVFAMPLIVMFAKQKLLVDILKNIRSDFGKLFSPSHYFFSTIMFLGILAVATLRGIGYFYSIDSFEAIILKYANTIQFVLLLFGIAFSIMTRFQKWSVIWNLMKMILGEYRVPKWVQVSATQVRTVISHHKKDTLKVLLTFSSIFFFFYFYLQIEVRQKTTISDGANNNIGRSVSVYFTPPRTPYFRIKNDQVEIKKHPLRIGFSSNPYKLASVDIDKLFHLSPPIQGTWKKASETLYEFMPKKYWEAGRRYHITLKDEFNLKNLVLDSQEYDFSMASFKGQVDKIKFYVNPKTPTEKKVVAHIGFNYPIERKSLEEKLSLTLRNNKNQPIKNLSFTATFDKTKTTAYIHSESIELADKDLIAEVSIDKGVKSQFDIKMATKGHQKSLDIPSIYSFMDISISGAEISYDKEDLPFYSMEISSNTELSEKELAKHFTLYELDRNPSKKITRFLKSAFLRFDYRCLHLEKGKSVVEWDLCQKYFSPNLFKMLRVKKYSFLKTKVMDPNRFKLSFDADPAKKYLYLLKKGFQSELGFKLKSDLFDVTTPPNLPEEIKLANTGSVLNLNGDKKLSVYTRGVSKLKVVVKQLLPGQIQHLLTLSDADKINPRFSHYSFDENNITDSKEMTLPISFDIRKGGYTSIELASFMKRKRGIFFVTFSSVNGSESLSQLVLVSDMAYIHKKDRNYENSHLYIMSASKGVPLEGVQVSVVYKNGKKSRLCVSDKTGYCFMTKPKLASSGFILEKDDDILFSKFNDYKTQVNYSRFDIGGDYTSSKNVKAFVFSDRNLYRPGEQGHLGIIVKDSIWSKKYENEIVSVKINDARGNLFLTKNIKIKEFGLSSFSFDLPYSAPTGSYNISVSLVSNTSWAPIIGSTTIKVQDFLPDKLKVSTRFNKGADSIWVDSNGLKGNISVRNLFGTAAAENKVTSRLTLSPRSIEIPKYRSYRFYNDKVLETTIREDLGDNLTDKNGQLSLPLDLSQYKDNTFELSLNSEAFVKAGGRSVNAKAKILISNQKFLIGIKKGLELNYLTKKITKEVDLIAVDSVQKSIEVNQLKLNIYEKVYRNTLVKQADGTFAYQDKREPTLVDSEPLKIQVGGTKYLIDNSRVGEFIAKIETKDGKSLNSFEYQVVGEADLARSLARSSELKMTLDKSDYKSGEIINISLKAPYSGSGLLTIEGDKIYAKKWFKLNKATGTVSIRIPDFLEGNAYINISMLRSPDSKQVFTSPFSYGVIPFSIDKSKREHKIELSHKALVKPGSTVDIKYRSSKPGRIILYAADEGILQLAKYQTPYPLAYFFKKRALRVNTFQIFSLILPSNEMVRKAFAAGGGAMGDRVMKKGRSLNPFKRKFTKATAFWSGTMDITKKWQTFKIDIPSHFNGTLKLYSIFVDDDSVGVSKRQIVSQDDVIISPTVPATLTPGDEAIVVTTITNNLPGLAGKDIFDVSIELGEGLKLIGDQPIKLEIEKGLELNANFKIKALKNLGNQKIHFVVKYKGGESRFKENVSIRPSTPYLRKSWMQVVSSGKVEVPVKLNQYFKEFFDTNILITSGYWALIKQSLHSLSLYPYGCTEQITSKAIPYLVFDDNSAGFTEYDREVYLQKTFDLLLSRQLQDGGLSLYPGGPVASDFINFYIFKFLTLAKNKNINIPDALFRKLLAYISILAENSNELSQAQALYLLALNEKQVAVKAKVLLNKNIDSEIINLYLAATFKILNDDKLAHSLLAKVDMKKESSKLRRIYVEMITRHFPDHIDKDLDTIIREVITDNTTLGMNSLTSGQMILALSSIATREPLKDLKVTVNYNSSRKSEVILSQNLSELKDRIHDIYEMSFIVPKGKSYFFSLGVNGYEKILHPEQKGFDVKKRFLNLKGEAVNKVRVGEDYIVEIQVQSSQEVQNAVITDLLPGGFDLVWTKWERGAFIDTMNPEFIEKREDRLNFYLKLDKDLHKFYYKVKASSVGRFVLPAVYVENMYKTVQRAVGEESFVEVLND